jgi:hypothetical protein
MQLDKPGPAGGRNCPYAVNEREADSVVWMPVIQRVVSLAHSLCGQRRSRVCILAATTDC